MNDQRDPALLAASAQRAWPDAPPRETDQGAWFRFRRPPSPSPPPPRRPPQQRTSAPARKTIDPAQAWPPPALSTGEKVAQVQMALDGLEPFVAMIRLMLDGADRNTVLAQLPRDQMLRLRTAASAILSTLDASKAYGGKQWRDWIASPDPKPTPTIWDDLSKKPAKGKEK